MAELHTAVYFAPSRRAGNWCCWLEKKAEFRALFRLQNWYLRDLNCVWCRAKHDMRGSTLTTTFAEIQTYLQTSSKISVQKIITTWVIPQCSGISFLGIVTFLQVFASLCKSLSVCISICNSL